MVVLAYDAAARPLRLAPTCTWHEAPPAGVVAQRHFGFGSHKDHGARHQQAVIRTRGARGQLDFQVFPLRLLLGRRHVARGLDEAAELRVRNVVGIHPEATYSNAVRGQFVRLRELVVVAHEEFRRRNPGHAGRPLLAVA
ncbi:hypothetical protein G6F32_015622 [Rhizopus arrhizus]|nr:hypothetical protein G6F32_015622 [Rhizopus arrhizus]